MSTTMTLAQLSDAIRQRADMVNASGIYTNTFVTASELTSYINQSYFELYDLLVQKYGDNYYVAAPLSFSTDGTTFQYPLPDGTNYSAAPALYKFLGLDLALSPNSQDSFVTIRPFMFSDRNRYAVPNFQSFYGVTNLRYRLNGTNLWLTPTPAAGQTLRLWYVPRLTQLISNSDTADGISGWTEYIIVDGVIKCKEKEESDVSVEMAQKQALIQRIESAAENRDAGNPAVVSDGQYSDLWWPTGNGSGYNSGAM